MKRSTLSTKTVACVAAAALVLTGCSNSEKDATTATPSSVTVTSDAQTSTKPAAEAKVTFTDAYVKAMDEGKDMTAIFGVIHNNSDKDVNITKFTATIDAKKFELHEVVDGQMREKEGGFVIPAGESMTLEPGKEHMMVMGVAAPVKAGDSVSVTLELADGTKVEVADVPVRTIGAGEENYGKDMKHGSEAPSEAMEHGSHENHEGHNH